MARLERGVRPIGFWSTTTSRPTASSSSEISPISVDLPDPETPVTAVNAPSGNSARTSRKLCRVTGPTFSQPWGGRT